MVIWWEWFIFLFVIWYANKKKVKNVSKDPSIYWLSYQNAYIKRRYKLVEGLDKWWKPVVEISQVERTQIRKKRQRKQFYNKKFREQVYKMNRSFWTEVFESSRSLMQKNLNHQLIVVRLSKLNKKRIKIRVKWWWLLPHSQNWV